MNGRIILLGWLNGYKIILNLGIILFLFKNKIFDFLIVVKVFRMDRLIFGYIYIIILCYMF